MFKYAACVCGGAISLYAFTVYTRCVSVVFMEVAFVSDVCKSVWYH